MPSTTSGTLRRLAKVGKRLASSALTGDLVSALAERARRLKAESGLRELRSENRILQRKYAEALKHGSDAAKSKAGSGAERWDELLALAGSSLDSAEIKAKIQASHKTFENKAYDRTWAKRISTILEVLETGERDLSRALAKIRRTEERARDMGLESKRWVINDLYMELPWRPAAAAYRSAVSEAVLDEVRADTTKIIETGSGWGEHLCNIFLEGGPVDATYHALELEEEGRKCSLLLAALEPDLRLEASFFDYRSPDYSMLPKDDEHTILLTAHSVEQVSAINENCILSALELGRRVTGIHFEPIGWQAYPESEWTEVAIAHHKRCTEMDYNRNLWPLLNRIQDAGKIAIRELKRNFIGLDHNPATYIVWEKV